ncbi:zinc transporter 2 [Eucalyptus grandis]|uniref:zinc transporter 2 n=1 Tax=Eucalyptus grandis TaxID=71139 RepID=UPI00192ED88D|nr:zinc transporter 2 [Eucalyptus grandis]
MNVNPLLVFPATLSYTANNVSLSSPLLSLSFLSLLLAAAVHGVDNGKDSSSNSVGDKHEDMRSKSLILAKIWCLTLVFVGTFVGGVSPYLLKWDEAFLLQGTYVAGGFFLATEWMRFPMDAIETFGDQTDREFSSTVMLSIAGSLLTMLVHFAISYLYGKQEKEQSSGSNVDLEVSGTESRHCVQLLFAKTDQRP